MARVYFLFRSQKEKAALKVRLQDKNDKGVFFQFEGSTQIHTSNQFWNITRKKQRGLSGIEKNEIKSINKSIETLEDFILKQYEKDNPKSGNKNWLKLTLKDYYTPKEKEKLYPIFLVDFIDSYLADKKALNELKESQRKRITTTKNKLIRLENETHKRYKLKDINEDFKADYITFSEQKKYSINTQNKEFERIKTICRYAQRKGLEVSKSLMESNFKINKEKSPKIYLESTEIEKIQKVDLKFDYLENARDWLLISIYSGQRISDFMRFTSKMIHNDENNRSFIIFKQIKTQHDMYLPLRAEIIDILNKRNGEFPRSISDQKYNDYIKLVCKEAGINTLCKGKKRICIAEEGKKPTKFDYRDVLGEFEKWELISSHIGRRTFATINYGNIPTPDLMYFTGHTTEKEFLNYIVRPDYDKAKRAFDSFNKLK
ncbi:phage integrase SAM-like domain-containing protein [Mariniflexile gromovii]|uniref:Phage integrase SAM-like domain-containing protein n=1 Tax=Mariniflexile gromovii TaxID=362523 RepID=A0ABS4BSK9_9FLAO|nr:phage integrase SAM-like domain-containing protein [Mariniflexile gromovii]MBP0903555.1 phage integrase SAM-like domain-containing protein [Mariniflexile gromovii]